MNAESGTAAAWSVKRWIFLLGLIAAAHLSFIFIFGETELPPLKRRRPAAVSQIASPSAQELVAYQDPTLFALPHALTFSGLNVPKAHSATSNSVVWPDEPYALELATKGLARTATGPTYSAGEAWSLPDDLPVFSKPNLPPPTPFPTQSLVRVEGALRGRALLHVTNLQTWPRADLLTNTVVGVTINPEGSPASIVLLSSSGLPEADQAAMQVANKVVFESSRRSDSYAALTAPSNHISGRMVFEWRTVPTNAPTANPPK